MRVLWGFLYLGSANRDFFLLSFDVIYFAFLPNCSGQAFGTSNGDGEKGTSVAFLLLGWKVLVTSIEYDLSCGFFLSALCHLEEVPF